MRSSRRAPSTTIAPCEESNRAVASPSPLLAPVMTTTLPAMLFPVLFIAHLLQPLHRLAVETLLNRDVRHRRGRRRAVPVLLSRREPDHVAGPDLLDRPAPALRAAAPRRHDQGLAQGVGVPRGPRAGLERDGGAGHARRVGRLEQGV